MNNPAQKIRYEHDRAATLKNRAKLRDNKNLYAWYQALYEHQFSKLSGNMKDKNILEIGSGSSPLKLLYPDVMTSDVLALDYLDYVFDCHEIGSSTVFADGELDVITLTNVLHHLRAPLQFLHGAARKLGPKGVLIATEPYYSAISTPIYRLLHHEDTDFQIKQPVLNNFVGPLTSANMALPQLIFFRHPSWSASLWKYYRKERFEIAFFSSLSYMLTGGMSYKVPVPAWLYRRLLPLDLHLGSLLPDLAAAFFTIYLWKK